MLTGDGLENEHIKVDSALIPCLLPFTCQNHSWTCPQHPRTFPTANSYAHHPIELPVANEFRNGLVCSRSPTRYTPATHPTENKSIHTYATPYATLRPTHKTSPLWTRLRSLTLRPTHTRSPYAGQKTSPTRTRFLLFTLRPTPTLRPHATPDQQNESALDSFAVVHLRPTPTPDRKRVQRGLVFCCSPYAQPPRYALTLRPTNKTSPLWTRLRSFIYAQYTCRTENESALDSFSGVHPTPNPHATPDRQNESALDSFAVVHPTPNPHAGQKTSPRWTRFLAFTLRPTHMPDRKRVRVGLVFWRSPYAQPTRYALTLRPDQQNESALDSFAVVHLRPTPTPDRKRVRVGLIFWRSPYA
ncbi:hypothetical protein DFH05DRAFT_884445 [Lentinula detonsa]|uniref:Uncharacterized protein n=1 Tax=Lentinula detonsa TaxID=2804962 RepID=A0A9W8P6V8_9AGAR|nr:hypothetical protein DFH05DRAFT_884445 [Lentinula detonsa]